MIFWLLNPLMETRVVTMMIINVIESCMGKSYGVEENPNAESRNPNAENRIRKPNGDSGRHEIRKPKSKSRSFGTKFVSKISNVIVSSIFRPDSSRDRIYT